MKCSCRCSCSVVYCTVVVVVVVSLSTYRPTFYLSICLSIYLSFYLQAWKRSYSARLPQWLNLPTSKTQQFCKTSSIFEVGNIKNEAILRDFLQTWKVECRANGLVPMRLAILPVHVSEVCACHEKVMPGHTKRCTCHTKSSSQNWRSDAPKCNLSWEISALTS